MAGGLFEGEQLSRPDNETDARIGSDTPLVDFGDCTSQGQRESPRVLGMITLNDLTRLEAESQSGNGWIACKSARLRRHYSFDALIAYRRHD